MDKKHQYLSKFCFFMCSCIVDHTKHEHCLQLFCQLNQSCTISLSVNRAVVWTLDGTLTCTSAPDFHHKILFHGGCLILKMNKTSGRNYNCNLIQTLSSSFVNCKVVHVLDLFCSHLYKIVKSHSVSFSTLLRWKLKYLFLAVELES